MRSSIKIGGLGLLVFGVSILTPPAQAAKKASSEEQVAVLMSWYRIAFDEGKYKQAEQMAEFAYELAPNDPQIMVALKLVRRQQPAPIASPKIETLVASPKVEMELERVMMKLDRVERQLRQMESQQRRQRTRIQIAKEPPGSPDAGDY